MFEDIFNDNAYECEELYASEAAINVANYYGIDLSACYEADESGNATKESGWKKFTDAVGSKAKLVAEKIKQFCTFIKRKVKELFAKITGKATFYMDPEIYKTNAIITANANKVIALASKGIALGQKFKEGDSTNAIEAICSQVKAINENNVKVVQARKAKSSSRMQVYNKPNVDGTATYMSDAETLSKEADMYEAFEFNPKPGFDKISTAMPELLRAKVAAMRAKMEVLNTYLAAPTSMPKAEGATK